MAQKKVEDAEVSGAEGMVKMEDAEVSGAEGMVAGATAGDGEEIGGLQSVEAKRETPCVDIVFCTK